VRRLSRAAKAVKAVIRSVCLYLTFPFLKGGKYVRERNTREKSRPSRPTRPENTLVFSRTLVSFVLVTRIISSFRWPPLVCAVRKPGKSGVLAVIGGNLFRLIPL
jgi:hypothetical protein